MGAVRKRQLAFLLPERRAHPPSSFFRISSFQPRYYVKISSVTYIYRSLTIMVRPKQVKEMILTDRVNTGRIMG
ncbi:hypothetical protein HMPREF0083_00961 [Aneurinibacillus aneurinilyticus ATCC 12856]|uniref:Uncharacterized protein n=1 Tax=Aneurinibacillus aneurinilyticus ATCC 12856 TaxID=649747 RepID=U1YJH3_ANEAE|nr:hypothetical protein HMPREF0083_00961 [Aneurinibacillus aneurinilyticus ATCC 12856]